MSTYLPPANLKDFERSKFSNQLYEIWHTFIKERAQVSKKFPAYFDTTSADKPIDPNVATPLWTGFPRTIKRRMYNDILLAAKEIEYPIEMGSVDPLYDRAITSKFREVQTGKIYLGPKYRAQDEYLEWVTIRDSDDNITEVLFTCEGPEYWEKIALDKDLLLQLYQEITGFDEIKEDDLFFDRPVCFYSRNLGGSVCYNSGDYNPFNIWNMKAAVHLTQPANTLGAEIHLAKEATLLYGDGTIVTEDPHLVVCGGYGGINRMSDPTIGSAVNAAVRNGKFVGLRNPVGLYIQEIDDTAFSLSDGTEIDIEEYFVPIRPTKNEVTDMIVRAKFKVPEGVMIDGRQATISDLLVDGAPILYGGQIADKVTMTLYANTAPDAPKQALKECSGKACTSPNNPNLIIAIDPSEECPSISGPSPLAATVETATEYMVQKNLLKDDISSSEYSRTITTL